MGFSGSVTAQDKLREGEEGKREGRGGGGRFARRVTIIVTIISN